MAEYRHDIALDKLMDLTVEVTQEFIAKTAERVIDRTPVRSGKAKGNWNVALDGSAPSGEKSPDSGGARTKRECRQQAEKIDENTKEVDLQNPLPYINRLEHGWSQQAPSGMVRITLIEADQLIRQAIEKVGK